MNGGGGMSNFGGFPSIPGGNIGGFGTCRNIAANFNFTSN